MHDALNGSLYLVKEHVGLFKEANNYDIYDAETNEVVDDEALADQAMAKVLVHLKVIIAEVTIALQTREKAVDTFTKFGLNLFFAGACSKLSRTFSLSAKEGQSILARLMELTGASKEMAQAFADNTNESGERPQ